MEDFEDYDYDNDTCEMCGSHRCYICGEMTCFGCSCDNKDDDEEDNNEDFEIE